MDFINKVTGSGNTQGNSVNEQVVQGQNSEQQSSGSGGFLGGIGDKLNSAAGGGRESEKNEDYLDKGMSALRHRLSWGVPIVWQTLTFILGVDFVQEKFMGQGPQDNESAVEQAKDEQISDFIRGQYKSTTGSDIPIKDKETRLG
jgi:hypothetical protein